MVFLDASEEFIGRRGVENYQKLDTIRNYI
jgi:hypothetical protein